MELADIAKLGFIALLLALIPTGSAASATNCPYEVTGVVEGSNVTLTASPADPDYYYVLTLGAGLTGENHTGVGYGEKNIVKFTVGACPGPFTVDLTMRANGAPESCKADCAITIQCTPLCEACPVIENPCIVETPTWEYDCSGAPASLFYEWYTNKNNLAVPVEGTASTWGGIAVPDSKTWAPNFNNATAFNVPDESTPIKYTWVQFVVRSDADGNGVPDTTLKFCSQNVTLYYQPTTTMASSVAA